jgi:hypothetical protein
MLAKPCKQFRRRGGCRQPYLANGKFDASGARLIRFLMSVTSPVRRRSLPNWGRCSNRSGTSNAENGGGSPAASADALNSIGLIAAGAARRVAIAALRIYYGGLTRGWLEHSIWAV